MTTIIISNLLDRHQSYPLAGDEVYNIIDPKMTGEESFIMDMAGVSSVPTVFLNASLGRLIDVYGIANVKSKIGFVNIMRAQLDRIRKYFDDYAEVIEKR